MSASDPTKYCTRCKRDLPLTEFHKKAASKDGLQPRCKACVKEYNRNYYLDKREDLREYFSAYRQTRAESIREYLRKWRKDNPDYMRDYRRDNVDAVRDRQRKWSRDNPDKVSAYGHKRRALKANVPSDGIPLDLTDQVCYICGATAEAVDHVVPLSKGGHDVIDNKAPVCKSCNSAKRDHTWPGQPDWDDFVARRNQ